MSAMVPELTVVSSVSSTVCPGADQRKHQSSASLAFVRSIHWWLVNSPHKGPVTRKMFPVDDVIIMFNWGKGINQNQFPPPLAASCSGVRNTWLCYLKLFLTMLGLNNANDENYYEVAFPLHFITSSYIPLYFTSWLKLCEESCLDINCAMC